MSSSALPPPGNLPSWSRVSSLDRSRYPKPFIRDRIPLPPTGGVTIAADSNPDSNNPGVEFIGELSASEQQGLLRYYKGIKFLQQQHEETLVKLHEELDNLKKENKELKFKLVLTQGGHAFKDLGLNIQHPPSAQVSSTSDSVLSLRTEVDDLKKLLQESDSRYHALQKTIHAHSVHSPKRSAAGLKNDGGALDSPPEQSGDSGKKMVTRLHRKYSVSHLSSTLPLNATLNPLKIQDDSSQQTRVPTMSECETIIQQLHETNCQQLEELSKLRMEKRESTSSRVSSPDLKLFGPNDNESFSDTRLPRIPVKPTTKKSIASARSAERVVTLPALVNTIPSNVADRHRRQQALRKVRSKEEFQ